MFIIQQFQFGGEKICAVTDLHETSATRARDDTLRLAREAERVPINWMVQRGEKRRMTERRRHTYFCRGNLGCFHVRSKPCVLQRRFMSQTLSAGSGGLLLRLSLSLLPQASNVRSRTVGQLRYAAAGTRKSHCGATARSSVHFTGGVRIILSSENFSATDTLGTASPNDRDALCMFAFGVDLKEC
ncbi:hypothetical protein GQ44DRAFT_763122 [Phaeosphaeriaceae sp. PMI808]|nr:hypothetical protein GQ44DRAFT_763122 [Phaeosphaeriaceae sp. PMI808]